MSKNKNRWSGYYSGNDLEERIIKQLSSEGFEPRKEKTLTDSKRRRKDLKADIQVNTGHKLECKSTTDNTNLTIDIVGNHPERNIKFHQICNADYFVLEFRPQPIYIVPKITLLKWWSELSRKKMSIKWQDVKEIGFELDTFDFLRG